MSEPEVTSSKHAIVSAICLAVSLVGVPAISGITYLVGDSYAGGGGDLLAVAFVAVALLVGWGLAAVLGFGCSLFGGIFALLHIRGGGGQGIGGVLIAGHLLVTLAIVGAVVWLVLLFNSGV